MGRAAAVVPLIQETKVNDENEISRKSQTDSILKEFEDLEQNDEELFRRTSLVVSSSCSTGQQSSLFLQQRNNLFEPRLKADAGAGRYLPSSPLSTVPEMENDDEESEGSKEANEPKISNMSTGRPPSFNLKSLLRSSEDRNSAASGISNKEDVSMAVELEKTKARLRDLQRRKESELLINVQLNQIDPLRRRLILKQLEKTGQQGHCSMRAANVIPRFVLFPESSFIRKWDIAMMTFLVYTCIVSPLEIAFLPHTACTDNVFFWLDRFVDVCFLVDIIINFRLAYKSEDGYMEIDAKKIARKYFLQWFLIDLVSIFPFDAVFDSCSGSIDGSGLERVPRLLRILRLFRLVKMIRVLRMSRIVRRLESRINMKYGVMQVMKFLVLILILAHWYACGFFLIGRLEESDDDDQETISWISQNDLDNVTVSDQYITSLYWSVMSLTTIGYGDVRAVTSSERAFSVFVMLTGAGVFAFVVGSLSNVVQGLDRRNIEFQKVMDELNAFMQYRRLPKSLRIRIRQYFFHCRQHIESMHEETILSSMSRQLRREVVLYSYKEVLRSVPTFSDSSDEFVADVAMVMGPLSVAPKEVIFSVGDNATHMYILSKGVVESLDRKNRVIGTMTDGSYFGDVEVLFGRKLHSTSTRSLSFSDLYNLSKKDLFGVLDRHKTMKARVVKIARKTLWKRAFAAVRSVVKMRQALGDRRSDMSSNKFRESSDGGFSANRGGASPGGASSAVSHDESEKLGERGESERSSVVFQDSALNTPRRIQWTSDILAAQEDMKKHLIQLESTLSERMNELGRQLTTVMKLLKNNPCSRPESFSHKLVCD